MTDGRAHSNEALKQMEAPREAAMEGTTMDTTIQRNEDGRRPDRFLRLKVIDWENAGLAPRIVYGYTLQQRLGPREITTEFRLTDRGGRELPITKTFSHREILDMQEHVPGAYVPLTEQRQPKAPDRFWEYESRTRDGRTA